MSSENNGTPPDASAFSQPWPEANQVRGQNMPTDQQPPPPPPPPHDGQHPPQGYGSPAEMQNRMNSLMSELQGVMTQFQAHQHVQPNGMPFPQQQPESGPQSNPSTQPANPEGGSPGSLPEDYPPHFLPRGIDRSQGNSPVQAAEQGNWPYQPPPPGGSFGGPSMGQFSGNNGGYSSFQQPGQFSGGGRGDGNFGGGGRGGRGNRGGRGRGGRGRGNDYIPASSENVPPVTNGCYALVEFKRQRVKKFESPMTISPGQYVIVDGDRGQDCGLVVQMVTTQPDGNLKVESMDGSQQGHNRVKLESGRVLRPAETGEIASLHGEIATLERQALKTCRERCEELQLGIEVIDCEYQFDRKKISFFFNSEHSVDFRDLVRELYKVFGARIWMENINPNVKNTVPQGAMSQHQKMSMRGPPTHF